MSQPDRNFTVREGHRPVRRVQPKEGAQKRLEIWQGRLEAAGSAEALAKIWAPRFEPEAQTFPTLYFRITIH